MTNKAEEEPCGCAVQLLLLFNDLLFRRVVASQQ